MKINRAQLKSILKECVKELITEGAFNNVIKESVNAAPKSDNGNNDSANIWNGNGVRRPAANDLQQQQNYQESTPTPKNNQYDYNVGQMNPNQRLHDLARTVAQNASGGNPKHAKMMESIFADTAMTTLQKQLANGEGGGHGVYVGEEYTQEIQQADMAELNALGGGAPQGHWAALAFGKLGNR
ncbi:MAG: hypothetical protein WC761_06425 [Candidatus Paceibacterota bacterium]|jgi:hypothetical protein